MQLDKVYRIYDTTSIDKRLKFGNFLQINNMRV